MALLFPHPAAGQSYLYWADAETGRIQRADLDDLTVETVLSQRLQEPSSLELDLTASKLYWSGSGGIERSRLDGSEVERPVVLGSGDFTTPVSRGVTVDEVNGKLYWINQDVIQRSNLDGSEMENLVSVDVVDSEGLEVDPVGGKLYWTNSSFSGGVIRRANLDGSGVEVLVDEGLFQPQKIELDVDGGKMYWTDLITNDVFRADLDGSSVEEIVTGQDNPDGIAIDPDNAKIYRTDRSEDAVRRADLDGSNAEELPLTLERPIDVAVHTVSGHLYTVVDDGRLYRSNLDGTDSELMLSRLPGFESVAIDSRRDALYLGGRDGLQRSDLAGANANIIAESSVNEVRLDHETGRVYWSSSDGIRRADADGANAEIVVAGDFPFNLILDL